MCTGQGPWGPDPCSQPFGRGKSELARANHKLAEPTLIWPSIGLGQIPCGRVFHPSRQILTRTRLGREILPSELVLGRVFWSAQASLGRAAAIAALLHAS